MNYIEVCFEIEPFSEDTAELIIAQIEDLPFESFVVESPYLKAYIPQESHSPSDIKTTLYGLTSSGEFTVKVTNNFIQGQNWNALWESNFSPIVVGNRCTVKATFHKGLPSSKYTITIDPKMAFGTGHHQTTYLMIETMLDMKIKGKKTLDMGCGTGILAILAVKMGAAAPVHAIDIDPVAVASSIENSRKNRVSEKIISLTGDASLIQASKYDLILANINRNIIVSDIETYARGLLSAGELLLSGFYREDVPIIEGAAQEVGLKIVFVREMERWSAMLLEKS